MSIVLWFVVPAIALALAGRYLCLRKFPSLNLPLWLRVTSAVIAVFGLMLALYQFDQVYEHIQRRSWPTVQGAVTSSRIAGERSYYPEVHYQYFIDSIEYFGLSTLEVTGFGGKGKRHDVAETLTEKYHLGKQIEIYVHPNDPFESYILPGPSFRLLGQLGLGALCWLCGLVLAALPGRRRDQHTP